MKTFWIRLWDNDGAIERDFFTNEIFPTDLDGIIDTRVGQKFNQILLKALKDWDIEEAELEYFNIFWTEIPKNLETINYD